MTTIYQHAMVSRVKETFTTTGTGTITLLGAADGFMAFSDGVGSGNRCYYLAIDNATFAWEEGIGQYTGGTLVREVVLRSTNADALVAFAAGTKDIFVTVPGAAAMGLARANILANGGFDVWQAGTTFSPAADTRMRTADMWWAFRANNGNYTVSRQGSQNDGAYSLRLKRTAATSNTDPLKLACSLETRDAAQLRHAPSLVLSFVATAGGNFSAAAGTLTAAVHQGTGDDENYHDGYTAHVTLATASFVLTTNPRRYFLQVDAPSTGAKGLAVVFSFTPVGTAGSDDSVYLEQVKLEIGAVAIPYCVPTPYEPLPFALALATCQRYYYKSFRYDITPAQNVGTDGMVYFFATGTATAEVIGAPIFVPQMRDVGNTVTFFNPSAANAHLRNTTQAEDTSGESYSTGMNHILVDYNGSAATVPGDKIAFQYTVEDPQF